MKHLKKFLALLLAAAMLFSLTACGGDSGAAADPNCGVYNATTAEMWGMEMSVEDLWAKGFSIELKDGGKAEFRIDGDKSSAKWTLNGTAFNVNGGGLDCSGTLDQGVMVLENVLDLGVTLTFEKEGGYTEAPAQNQDQGGSAGSDAPAEEELSAIEQQWDGTWYGVMYVGEAEGDFSGIPCDFYDVYTVVDVDAKGKGTLDVYLAGIEDAFASATCEAKDYGIDTIEGTIAGFAEINPSNWMFRQSPDWPGKYVIMDTIEYGDSYFEYYIFIRQWGDSWQADVDTDFEMVPPSWDLYEASIANEELPPVGFAPHGYAGSAASSSGSSAGNEGAAPSVPAEPSAPSASAPTFSGPTTTFDYGDAGEIFFDYASDSYYYEKKFGQHHIRSNDDTIKITFTADWGMDDYAARMDGYETLVAESGGVLEDGLSYGGYEAVRVTWEDVLGDITQETYILFGEGAGQYVGINVSAYAASEDVIAASDLEAILHSVRLK